MNNRLFFKAVNGYRDGTAGRWVACLAASRLGRGELDPLANELSLSLRAVRNLRAAGLAYRILRPLSNDVPMYARFLGYSHFGRLYGLLEAGSITPKECLIELQTALAARTPIEAFAVELEGVYENTGEDKWKRQVDLLLKKAIHVRDYYGVPENIRVAAAALVAELEKEMA